MIFEPNLMLIDALLQDAGSHTSNVSTKKTTPARHGSGRGLCLKTQVYNI
jgi:hypothetical protein